MMASSPDTEYLDELKIHKTRARGDTATLLPTSFQPAVGGLVQCPKPEKDIAAYDVPRLQQSLIFVETVLAKRDITPRSETFYELFKESIKDAMRTKGSQETQVKAAEWVAKFEFLANSNDFLVFRLSPDQQILQDEILKLRELQYLLRYGDYMKVLPNKVRAYASEHSTKNWQLISGKHQWTDVSANIRKEEEKEKEAQRKGQEWIGKFDSVRIAIGIACDDLGVDEQEVVWAIHNYAKRNEVAHNDFEKLKGSGDFVRLAHTLYADLHDLRCTFSSFDPENDIGKLESFIQQEIDWCFDVRDPDDCKSWVIKDQLFRFYQQAQVHAQKPTKREEKEKTKEEAKAQSEAKKARSVAASKGEPSARGQKRMASTEVPRGEEEEAGRRRTKMENLLKTKIKLKNQLENVIKGLEEMSKEPSES